MIEFTKLIVTVLAISNPIGNLAIFSSMAARSKPDQINACIRTMCIALLAIYLVSAFLGHQVLSLFGITLSSLQCAGGLLLLKIGLSMISGETDSSHQPKNSETKEDSKDKLVNKAIVPLALPLVGGPGAISTIIMYAHAGSASIASTIALICSLLVITAVIFLVFSFGIRIKALKDPQISSIITKVMGLIIMAMAMDMLLTGAKIFFLG